MKAFSNIESGQIFFLIGFMGSGKSLLSRSLAEKTNIHFVEMDDEIENAAGMTINKIFSTEGEERFRKLEQKVLHQLIETYRSTRQMVIISTGGGAPCFFDNMDVMNLAGTTIFINLSVERLSARLEHKKKERPLIRNKTGPEIKEYVKNTIEKRLPYYQRATIEVNMFYNDKARNIELLNDIILNS